MVLELDEKDLKNGVLGLVVTLVEIIRDVLKAQAMKRMESGNLTEEEIERLGEALMDLDVAIEEIKHEQGLRQAVQSLRDGLDDLINDACTGILDDASDNCVCIQESRVKY